ncbi:MAG: L,D-transpeptidase family protein [Actinobacteria bacterium]|nr:L,D-transpeptidase family protein [Actinomycetota bacterium]
MLFSASAVGASAVGGPLPPSDPRAWDRPDDPGGTIDLGWSESPSPGIAAYRVYRSETPGGPYQLVGQRSTDVFINYLGYVDTGLRDGVTYYYVITSVDERGRESAPTPELSATPEAQVFTAAVTPRKSIVISLAEQKMYCLENGRPVYDFRVSTGKSSTPTPTGDFKILYKDREHPVPKYPGCVCYYWMGFYEDYAIHAWPTYYGVQADYSSLGHPVSNGCVRLDPTQAHIPYEWAPVGTPVSIIPGPFQAPPAPIQGGHVSMGTAAPHTDWYFAEGYTGGGFNEYILVFNPGDAATAFDFRMMLPDGSSQTHTFTIGPHTRLTLNVDDFPGMSDTDVSVHVRAERPVVAERAMYFDYHGKTGGHVSLGVNEPSREWFFAEGYTGGGFDEYILVLNPGDAATAFDVDMALPDGSSQTHTFNIGPHTRLTLRVDDFPGMSDTDVSVHVRARGPVVVERAMYFGYNGIDGGTVTSGTNEPATEWFFAEGYTGGGFDEYILVFNPNREDATVTLDFMKPDGSVSSHGFLASARSRITIIVDAVPEMGDTDVSVRLDSDLPVVAERAMYFGYAECPGGHAQVGCTDPGILHLFAEGYTSQFFDAYLLVMNPNENELPVVVTFCRPDGTTVGQPMMIGPHSRATLKVNLVPGLSNGEFSIRVDTGGPAVVERAMYFSYPR